MQQLSHEDESETSPLPGLPRLLTISQASRTFGVARMTLYRRLERGEIHGAQRQDDGWLLPIEGLLNAGLRPVAPGAQQLSHEDESETSNPQIEIEHERDNWRLRAMLAEAELHGVRLALDTATQALDTTQQVMRALEAVREPQIAAVAALSQQAPSNTPLRTVAGGLVGGDVSSHVT